MAAARRSGGPRGRRVFDAVLLVVVALVVAVIATVAAAASGGERVAQLWAAATIAADGSAQVTEVIDYDFGPHQRHGFFRDVPGLRTSAPVRVSSPDAPSEVALETSGVPRIRIGDPSLTVNRLHRYILSYTLDGVAPGGRVAWNAVGTQWEVPVERVSVHVLAASALADPHCTTGAQGSGQGCAIQPAEPGHLVTHVESLDPGRGVTVSATAGEQLGKAPAVPVLPQMASGSSGMNPLVPGALAGGLALLSAMIVSRVVRRAGREHRPAVGLPLTTGPGDDDRIDMQELAAAVVPSPALPQSVSASQGGVLLDDGVLDRHKAAWLVGQAVAGTIELEPVPGGHRREITMVRRQPGDAFAGPILDLAFRGRDRVVLGRYDEDFARAWRAINEDLTTWRETCGLWDADADRRRARVRLFGVLGLLAGLAVAVVSGIMAADGSGPATTLAVVAGVLAGGGGAAAIRGWELRVLTPEGSAAWMQVAALRRFLAQSPPTAVDEVLATGDVGQYTAWAIALGQADRWSQLAANASVPMRSPYDRRGLLYAGYGPVFVSSCSSAGVAPSSSSGGGGGGGVSVGGGAGGGGGGSW